VFACDSFQGFDRNELQREREAGLTTGRNSDFTSTSLGYVKAKLERLGVEEVVKPIAGYFSSTLSTLPGPYCLVFIDCDLQQSMDYCAHTLWPRVSQNGRMVFDDYTSTDYRGARLAIDTFVAESSATISEHGLMRRLYYVVKR
jgi:predicted O-methyltransferase YrrM